jgi:hypothetical protein
MVPKYRRRRLQLIRLHRGHRRGACSLEGSAIGSRAGAALAATGYLCLNVVVVAAGEEWLYRGYAIERLQALTGALHLAPRRLIPHPRACRHRPLRAGPGGALTRDAWRCAVPIGGPERSG